MSVYHFGSALCWCSPVSKGVAHLGPWVSESPFSTLVVLAIFLT